MDSRAASPSASRLLSLPREIIALVGAHLDNTSLVELSRTHRKLIWLAGDQLWGELVLDLPQHYGEIPQILPHEPSDGEPYRSWLRAENSKAEMRYREALRYRLKCILDRGQGRNWRLVRKIRMLPWPGPAVVMVAVLEMAWKYLEELDIRGESEHASRLAWVGQGAADPWRSLGSSCSFGHKLFEARIIMPALTTLRLGRGIIRTRAHIMLLCSLTPALTSLDLDFSRVDHAEFLAAPTRHSPWPRPTNIRRLRYSFGDCAGQPDPEALVLILNLMGASPKLAQVMMEYNGDQASINRDLIQGLSRNKEMVDLYWPASGSWIDRAFERNGFPSLKRLVLKSDDWLDELKSQPIIPSLKHLYYDRSGLPQPPGGTPVLAPDPSVPQYMWPSLCISIWDTPKLGRICNLRQRINHGDVRTFERLDQLEASGLVSGTIGSIPIQHPDLRYAYELTYARLLVDGVGVGDCISDLVAPYETQLSHPSRRVIGYIGRRDAQNRTRSFERSAVPVWQTYTSFDDMVVPLELIDEMRRVEGITEADWNKRNVEIGDEAKQILVDWWLSARKQLEPTEEGYGRPGQDDRRSPYPDSPPYDSSERRGNVVEAGAEEE